MFKKKFDHNDLSNYQPITNINNLVTLDFLNKKHKNLMPDYVNELIFLEYQDIEDDVKESLKQEIINKKNEYDNKLMNEYLERINENNLEDKINNLSINNE